MTRPFGATTEPTISGIEPVNASAGTGSLVTIRGSGFGAQTDGARVEFLFRPAHDGKAAEHISAANVISWSDAEIVCAVPVDMKGYARSASSGPVRVVTSSGLKSKGHAFNVPFGFRWRLPNPVHKFVIVTRNAGWRRMVRAAADTWNDTGHFLFVFSNEATTTPGRGNGVNEIYWSDVSQASWIAQTQASGAKTPTEIDIVFNKKSWLHWGSDVLGKYDVQTFALHEMGHVVGLRDLYGTKDKHKAMYGWRGMIGPSDLSWGVHRSLSSDDIAGVRWIYPKPPKNDWIAFVYEYDIWTMDPDSSNRRNLTNTPDATECCPTWSPDRAKLAYLRFPGASAASAQLWTMDSDGSDQAYFERVYPEDSLLNGMPLQDIAWAPNGKWLALSQGYASAARSGHVTLADVTTHEVTDLYVGEGILYQLSWRPDSLVVALDSSNEPYGPGNLTWGVSVTSGDLAAIPNLWAPTSDLDYWVGGVRWSPDGSRVLYWAGRDLPSDPENQWDAYLLVAAADGSSHKVLDSEHTRARKLSDAVWSPDGRKIAYTVITYGETAPNEEIWIVDLASDRTMKLVVPYYGQLAWNN